MSKFEATHSVLKSLKSAIPEIQGLVVAGVDGLAIASDMPEGESTRAAAMAATALGLSRRIAQTVHLGDFQEVVIRGGEGYLVVYGAGEKAVLAVSLPSSVNLGLIHLEARDRATQIAAILEAS